MTAVTVLHVIDDVVRSVMRSVVRRSGELQLVDGLGDLQVLISGGEVGEGGGVGVLSGGWLLRSGQSQRQRRAQAGQRRKLKSRRDVLGLKERRVRTQGETC